METGQEIIANYIQSLSPRGLLIVYEDHEVIQKWWRVGQEDIEKILLVLSEILPAYFERRNNRNFRLKNIEHLVSRELRQ